MHLTTPLGRAPISSYIYLLAILLLGPLFLRPSLHPFIPKQEAFSKADHSGRMTAWQVDVPGLFTYPVVQQPEDNAAFVTNRRNSLTQFRMAAHDGVTGVLAHNYLSGRDFYKLQVGQRVSVWYDHQAVEHYQVTSIHRYQKLEPASLRSDLIDLETHRQLTTPEVYDLYYRGSHHLIFQTCMEGEGRLDWGLLFVVAEPAGD